MAPEWKRGIKFNNATPCYSMSRTFYNWAALRKMKLIMRLGNRQLVTGLLGWEVSEVTGVGVRGHQTHGHGL